MQSLDRKTRPSMQRGILHILNSVENWFTSMSGEKKVTESDSVSVKWQSGKTVSKNTLHFFLTSGPLCQLNRQPTFSEFISVFKSRDCDRKAGNFSWMIFCTRSVQLLAFFWLTWEISENKNKVLGDLSSESIVMFISWLPPIGVWAQCYTTVTEGKHLCEISVLKDLGVLGVWELSLLSVVAGLSLFCSRPGHPCSSEVPGCLGEGSRPDMNSMLCFRLSSLSYWKEFNCILVILMMQ